MIAGILFPVKMSGEPSMKWWMASNLLNGLVLSVLASRAPWRGWKLAALLVALPLSIQFVNLVEGAFFLVNSGLDFKRLLVSTTLAHLLVLPLFFLIFRTKTPAPAPLEEPAIPLSGKVWRFVVCDISYVFLYYLAGMIIIPYVRDFYATQAIPAAWKIISLQELLRAPIFIALCLLLKYMMRLPKLGTIIAVGAAFTILSGVIPLMTPNPFFPDSIRWVHFGEVVSENFVFGMIVGWLWTPRAPQLQAVPQAA